MASNKKMHNNFKKSKGVYNKQGSGDYKQCAASHPKLPIIVGDKTYFVTGGSCVSRVPSGDYDVFVGLDVGYSKTKRYYPWEKGVEFLYRVPDMGVPKSLASFKKMLGYLEKAILNRENVFIGCIGGHGRTGLVLAALVAKMTGNMKAVPYVRKNYCKKAVESEEQIEWLHKNFGIKKVKSSKNVQGWSNLYYDMHLPVENGTSYINGFSGGEPRIQPKGKGRVFGNAKIETIS